ncbi:MAG TPA: glycosyltransferase, partial [Solirubrobacteraceae bacterium]|nr:glycosyltransferase [Solirubrobacteraceae bacterium]
MILFLHNRYRTTGGEERVVEDLMWLVRERLGEPAELLTRDSMALGRRRAAAGLLRGGLDPHEVADAVRHGGARVVHAHNLHPTLGWRALAAARGAGARVVVHLHQYRLVCAVGVCFTQGEECTRCHRANTLPGVLRNCRGSRGEALAYGAGLALWQRRLVQHADAVIVPSVFARERLRELGAPLRWERVHVLAPPVRALAEGAPDLTRHNPSGSSSPGPSPPGFVPEGGAHPDRAELPPGSYALVVSRLSPEKGIDVAIEACRVAGIPLVVAGEGLAGEAQNVRSNG